jgi:hypothetical protein
MGFRGLELPFQDAYHFPHIANLSVYPGEFLLMLSSFLEKIRARDPSHSVAYQPCRAPGRFQAAHAFQPPAISSFPAVLHHSACWSPP